MCNLGWKTACKLIIFTERYPAKNMDLLSILDSLLDIEKKKLDLKKKNASTFHLDHHQRLPLWEPAKFFTQLEKSFFSPLRPLRQTEVLSQEKYLAAKKQKTSSRPPPQ